MYTALFKAFPVYHGQKDSFLLYIINLFKYWTVSWNGYQQLSALKWHPCVLVVQYRRSRQVWEQYLKLMQNLIVRIKGFITYKMNCISIHSTTKQNLVNLKKLRIRILAKWSMEDIRSLQVTLWWGRKVAGGEQRTGPLVSELKTSMTFVCAAMWLSCSMAQWDI